MGGVWPSADRGNTSFPVTFFLFCGFPLACRSDVGHRLEEAQDPTCDVRPGLAEIFLKPTIMGTPPSVEALSPDGRFLLLRWNGEEKDEDEAGTIDARLIDVNDPQASGSNGCKIADLLPSPPPPDGPTGTGGDGDETKPPALGPIVWSHHGHTLAVGRGANIFLVDPTTRTSSAFLLAEVAPKEDETDDGQAQRATQEGRAIHEEIRSLAFTLSDDALRFADAQELYSLPFAYPHEEQHTLNEATWCSEAIDAPALKVRWSLDLSVVFGEDPTPVHEVSRGDEEPPVHQVYHLNEGRGVTLWGMKGEQWLERMAISEDGRFVIGVAYDRSREPVKNLIPDYLTDRVSTREARNTRAEDVSSPFQLWVWNTANGERKPLLPDGPRTLLAEPPENGSADGAEKYPGKNPEPEQEIRNAPHRLRTIGWAPQRSTARPARFAFELYSSDFRRVTVWCWTEGYCEKLWEERDPAWIGGPARNTRWTHDGRFLILGSESTTRSTRPGHAQLFSIDPDSLEKRQLTQVAGEVTRFRPLKDGGLIFEASRDDLGQRAIGWIRGEALSETGGDPVRWYAVPPGFNTAAAGSRDGSRIAFRHSKLFEPTEIWSADLERSVQLTRTRPSAFDAVDWIRPERLVVRSPDGQDVFAHLYLPPGTSSNPGRTRARPRATIVFVHGAGYLQNVTDSMTRYPENLMFHSRLAHMGYPVIDVDYRGSAGYGRDFRTDVQYHLGGKDLDDIHLVVDELVRRGVVDPERVGIYGGSYGGFLALMALFTAGERWTVGAALRAVTDWRTYNPLYTQPRLGRPSTHPEAYVRSSPIDHIDELDDPVLILHGMLDGNVFAQDSIRLIEELIDRGKEFDAMLYPSQGHAFQDGPHWLDEYRRIERYLTEHLGPPLREQ
ncbi:MAG: hypothetical protein CMJ89_19840 [Planctomycetes bacterium]|nr:hypothetical protein [Planctomycetota bacterium]